MESSPGRLSSGQLPTGPDHWVRWHQQYDEAGSSLRRRLEIVSHRLRQALDAAPPGPLKLVSMCAGEGRDVLGVLPGHPRLDDVAARLVELDPHLVAVAREQAAAAGLSSVEVAEGDASSTSAYAGMVPADIVLVCGVFGNVPDEDVCATVSELPHLCAPGATVIWTRHRMAPDLTPTIRGWFADAGFEEIAFDAEQPYLFGVGTARFMGTPAPFRPGRTMFTFRGDGAAATR